VKDCDANRLSSRKKPEGPALGRWTLWGVRRPMRLNDGPAPAEREWIDHGWISFTGCSVTESAVGHVLLPGRLDWGKINERAVKSLLRHSRYIGSLDRVICVPAAAPRLGKRSLTGIGGIPSRARGGLDDIRVHCRTDTVFR